MADSETNSQPVFTKAASIVVVASMLLASLVIVNPFREMLGADDSWIYARMVEHLLKTGKYHLDAGTAANMPVQIYLAAGLAKVFGYSLILLRFTTLGLLVVALICMYLLVRELGNSRAVAILFTLALLASPLVLALSFAFMSDVQFIAWMLLALLLYVRGIRRLSGAYLFAGSIAAGCTIGTRQFGMALIAGLVACWIVSREPIRLPLRLLVLALAIPCGVAAAQLYAGLTSPTIVQTWRMEHTHLYWSSPPMALARELFWRFSVMTQYLAICLIPLLPLSFWMARRLWKERLGRVPLWMISIAACGAIVLALWMSSSLTARPLAAHRAGLWEPLQLDWVFPNLFGHTRPVMRLVDVIGIIGAAPLVCLLSYSAKSLRSLPRLRAETVFLIASGFGLLALHLPYGQLNDTYMAGMLPFVLLLVAEISRQLVPNRRQLRLGYLASAIVLVVFSLWLRADYDYEGAAWKAADSLQRQGVAPADIAANFSWELYNGLFDSWIAAGHPGSIDEWYRDQRGQSKYVLDLAYRPEPVPGMKLLGSFGYHNVYFSKRYVLTMERVGP